MREFKFKMCDKDINKLEYEVNIEEKSERDEIKFRAWDKVDLKIREVVGISFYHGAISAKLNDEEYLQDDSDRFELMQYTGLTDKNGKEIYEGDIVKADSEYGESVRDIVCWSYGSFYVANHTFKELSNLEVIRNTHYNKGEI